MKNFIYNSFYDKSLMSFLTLFKNDDYATIKVFYVEYGAIKCL